MIHGHGDDLYKSQVQIKANFSTNVWYEADTRPLCDFLSTHLEGIFHYPEPDAGSFRKVAAACHGLTPEQVLVGNGATELFYMVAHAFSGNRTLIPVPSFTEYEDACTLYDHHIQFVGQVDVEHIPEHTNLMFICNPNNPDGRIWSLEEITALVKNYPDMVLVVDESFIHFAPGTESALSLLKEYSNEEVDLAKVIPMVLIHDLVEIDAGDTYAYDEAGAKTKRERETKAADRIFGLLPSDQGTWLRELWEEFEAYETAEAKFAHVLDNAQPLLLNDASNGRSWAEHGVHKSQIYKRNEHTSEGSREIWEYMKKLVDKHIRLGNVIDE